MASILVLVSPAGAAVATEQKIALTAITDDRFGVRWSVSPAVASITPSSSYNQAAVIFTAPQEPGIYTATATSLSKPSQKSSATITVTDRADLYIHPLVARGRSVARFPVRHLLSR